MAIVSNVLWDCPGCSEKNEAQIHDDRYGWHIKQKYHYSCVPYGSYLSWNPPCTKCGEFELQEPKGNISFGIVQIDNE